MRILNVNPYILLIIVLLFGLLISGCQTWGSKGEPPITLIKCSRACYPGLMSSASVFNGACECRKAEDLP